MRSTAFCISSTLCFNLVLNMPQSCFFWNRLSLVFPKQSYPSFKLLFYIHTYILVIASAAKTNLIIAT